jgi:hypothetical protein
MRHCPTARLLITTLALAWVPTLAQEAPSEKPPARPDTLTVEAKDASVAELVRIMGRAVPIQVVLDEGAVGRKVTVNLPNVDPETALQAICEAAGLHWTRQGDIYVVGAAPRLFQVETSQPTVARPGAWRLWDGMLADETASEPFAPIRTKVENGTLRGTLGDIVADLAGSGLDIALDPSMVVGMAERALELGWHGDANTVEHVLLRLAVTASLADPTGARLEPFVLLQWVEGDGQAMERWRVVPGPRWYAAQAGISHTEWSGDLDARVAATERGMAESGGHSATGYAGTWRGWAVETPEVLQKPIDLKVDDVPLTEALKALAAELGKPIGLAEGVSGDARVSMQAVHAPLHQVLRGILRPWGLTITYGRGDDFDGITVVPVFPQGTWFLDQPSTR